MMTALRLMLLLALLATSSLVAPLWAQDARTAMERGLAAYEAGRYAEALDYFNQVVARDPGFIGVYEQRANTEFILRQYGLAEADYTRALERYFRQDRQQQTGTYREGGMTILLDLGSGGKALYAQLYNNRGATRYLLGQTREAIADFQEALYFDPNFQLAQQNLSAAQQGVGTGDGSSNVSWSPDGNRYPYTASSNRYDRPVPALKPANPAERREQTVEIRDLRHEALEGGSRGFNWFGPKEFKERNIPRRGKSYKTPPVAHISQNYLSVEEVLITDKSTFVTIKVVNPEEKVYEVSLSPRGQPGAYVLTDRQPSRTTSRRFRLKSIEGMATYPATTPLKPGEEVTFTLEFEKIPDTLGFVNLVEGDRQDGEAWHFFEIDLTN